MLNFTRLHFDPTTKAIIYSIRCSISKTHHSTSISNNQKPNNNHSTNQIYSKPNNPRPQHSKRHTRPHIGSGWFIFIFSDTRRLFAGKLLANGLGNGCRVLFHSLQTCNRKILTAISAALCSCSRSITPTVKGETGIAFRMKDSFGPWE